MHVSNNSKFLCRTALDEEATWQDYYEEAVEYRQGHDNNNPQDGGDLSRWIIRQRNMAARVGLNLRDRRRVEILRQAGILRRVATNESSESWEANYSALLEYIIEYNDLPPGIRESLGLPAHELRLWLNRQQDIAGKERQSEEEIARTQRLRASGLVGTVPEMKWNIKYKTLFRYLESNGGNYHNIHKNIKWFSSWANRQRNKYFDGKMKEEQSVKLDDINFNWNAKEYKTLAHDAAVASRDRAILATDGGRPIRSRARAGIEFIKRAKMAGNKRRELEKALGYSLGLIWDDL